MGLEDAFGERLAGQLRPLLRGKYSIETKRSLLYAVSFDDEGRLQLGQNDAREPTRGGGTGFEQGGMPAIPPRTLRLGTEFDFIAAVPAEPGTALLARLARMLKKELRLSCSLTAVLRGTRKIGFLHRDLRHGKPI